MILSLTHFQHPHQGMAGGRHIAENNAGIKFSTAGAMLDHNGRYHDQRVSSEWYISGVKIMTPTTEE